MPCVIRVLGAFLALATPSAALKIGSCAKICGGGEPSKAEAAALATDKCPCFDKLTEEKLQVSLAKIRASGQKDLADALEKQADKLADEMVTKTTKQGDKWLKELAKINVGKYLNTSEAGLKNTHDEKMKEIGTLLEEEHVAQDAVGKELQEQMLQETAMSVAEVVHTARVWSGHQAESTLYRVAEKATNNITDILTSVSAMRAEAAYMAKVAVLAAYQASSVASSAQQASLQASSNDAGKAVQTAQTVESQGLALQDSSSAAYQQAHTAMKVAERTHSLGETALQKATAAEVQAQAALDQSRANSEKLQLLKVKTEESLTTAMEAAVKSAGLTTTPKGRRER